MRGGKRSEQPAPRRDRDRKSWPDGALPDRIAVPIKNECPSGLAAGRAFLRLSVFFPGGLFLPHTVAEGAQLFAEAQVLAVAVDDEPGLVKAELAVLVQQALVHIAGYDLCQKEVMAAQRDDLRDPAFEVDRAFFEDGAVGQDRAGGCREPAGGEFVHIPAAFDAAPVHRADQCLRGQIDGELPALPDEVVTEPLRSDADGYHAGLGADGARPADGDEVGGLQPAAGDQHRRFRVQQGAAFPALFAHP